MPACSPAKVGRWPGGLRRLPPMGTVVSVRGFSPLQLRVDDRLPGSQEEVVNIGLPLQLRQPPRGICLTVSAP